MKSKEYRNQAGFTLLEMAIVLLILSIVLVMGLRSIGAQMTNRSYKETNNNMGMVKDALTTYLRENNRLPCPDLDFTSPDGRGDDDRDTSDDTTTLCNGNFGIVPWQEIRLPRDLVLDGFGNFISYYVSTNGNATDIDNWTVTKLPINGAYNQVAGNTGRIIVNDGEATPNPIGGSPFAIVLVSHGKNGDGAFTSKGIRNVLPVNSSNSNELANTPIVTNVTTQFVTRGYTEDTSVSGGTFDDVVLALTSQDLLEPLIDSKAIISARGQVQKRAKEIQDIVVNQAITSCLTVLTGDPAIDPPSSTLDTPLDPWGNVYTFVNNNASAEPLVTGYMLSDTFTIRSSGPPPSGPTEQISFDMDWVTVMGRTNGACPNPISQRLGEIQDAIVSLAINICSTGVSVPSGLLDTPQDPWNNNYIFTNNGGGQSLNAGSVPTGTFTVSSVDPLGVRPPINVTMSWLSVAGRTYGACPAP